MWSTYIYKHIKRTDCILYLALCFIFAEGKTHTILGTVEDPGLIPRCVKDIFALIEDDKSNKPGEWLYDVTYSYLEIYQEKVHIMYIIGTDWY